MFGLFAPEKYEVSLKVTCRENVSVYNRGWSKGKKVGENPLEGNSLGFGLKFINVNICCLEILKIKARF
jgi:hypothetical protein